jgi:hypothetical protein
MTPLVCAACGQPGPPFHLLQDCPVVKARSRPAHAPPLKIAGEHGPQTRRPQDGKLWTRPPRLD